MVSSASRATVERIRQETQRASTTVRTGLVVSAGWISNAPSTVINVDGVEFKNLPMAGELNLIPGQTVSVMRTGAQLVVIGPGSADTMPLQGTVSATGASTCQVQLSYSTGIRTVNAPWLTHYSPTIGDLVKLEWAYGTPVVVGKLSAALPNSLTPPFVPVPPTTGTRAGVATFSAIDSATFSKQGSGFPPGFQTGRSMHTLWANNITARNALWFYGDAIKASSIGRVASGAPSIFLDITKGSLRTWLTPHTLPFRNSTGLNYPLNEAIAVPSQQFRGWIELPETWGNHLMSNEWGINCYTTSGGGTFSELNGIDVNSQSGTLRIPWREA